MKLELIGKPEGCKLLRMTLEVEPPLSLSSRIISLSIRGDFFAIPEEAFDEIQEELCGATIGEFADCFDRLSKEKALEFEGINSKGLMELIEKELSHGS